VPCLESEVPLRRDSPFSVDRQALAWKVNRFGFNTGIRIVVGLLQSSSHFSLRFSEVYPDSWMLSPLRHRNNFNEVPNDCLWFGTATSAPLASQASFLPNQD